MDSIGNTMGTYITANRTPPLYARLLPSVVFYIRFLRVVFRSSAMAKRGEYGNEEWWESSYSIIEALESVGVRLEISGVDIIQGVPGACVFVANHMSTLETIILPGIIQPHKDVTFVVKRGIIEYPVFKHIMLARDPIVVDRVNVREDLRTVLEEGTLILESGRSIIIFPQTTRSIVFEAAHFNSIGVKLARRASVPVIPIAVKSDAWGIGTVVKEFGRINPSKKVHIAFGEPITVKTRGSHEQREVVDFIGDSVLQWGGQIA